MYLSFTCVHYAVLICLLLGKRFLSLSSHLFSLILLYSVVHQARCLICPEPRNSRSRVDTDRLRLTRQTLQSASYNLEFSSTFRSEYEDANGVTCSQHHLSCDPELAFSEEIVCNWLCPSAGCCGSGGNYCYITLICLHDITGSQLRLKIDAY